MTPVDCPPHQVEARLGEALAAAEEKAATAAAEAAAASEAMDAMQAQFVALKMELEAARVAKVQGATVPPLAMAQPAQSRLASSEARDVGLLQTRLAATEVDDAGGNGGSSGGSRSGELKEAWAKIRALEEAATLTREASSRQVSQAVAGQKVLQAVLLARYRKLQQKFASALEEARVAATAAAEEERHEAEARLRAAEEALAVSRAEALATRKAVELLEAELAELVDGGHQVVVGVVGRGDRHLHHAGVHARAERDAPRTLRELDGENGLTHRRFRMPRGEPRPRPGRARWAQAP